MRTGVKDKEDIIPWQLLKLDIPAAFALCIATLHFNKAVHQFANVLGVSRIGNLCSIFKKDVIIAHLWFDAGGLLAIREVYPLREGQFAKINERSGGLFHASQ